MSNLLLTLSNSTLGSTALIVAQGAKNACSTLATKTHTVVSNAISSSTTKVVGMATSALKNTVSPLINVGLTLYNTVTEPSSADVPSEEQNDVETAVHTVLSQTARTRGSDAEHLTDVTNLLIDMGALPTKEEVEAVQSSPKPTSPKTPSPRATPPSSPASSTSSRSVKRKKVVASSSNAVKAGKAVLILLSPLLAVLAALGLMVIFVIAGPSWMKKTYQKAVETGAVASAVYLTPKS
jgi:hypothetical protein